MFTETVEVVAVIASLPCPACCQNSQLFMLKHIFNPYWSSWENWAGVLTVSGCAYEIWCQCWKTRSLRILELISWSCSYFHSTFKPHGLFAFVHRWKTLSLIFFFLGGCFCYCNKWKQISSQFLYVWVERKIWCFLTLCLSFSKEVYSN